MTDLQLFVSVVRVVLLSIVFVHNCGCFGEAFVAAIFTGEIKTDVHINRRSLGYTLRYGVPVSCTMQ